MEGFETKVKDIEADFNKLDEESSDIKFINHENNPEEIKEESDEEEYGDQLNESGTHMVAMSWNVS